jgi:aspartyl-tRNA(Asn)/glutamyl-tRNA(Gln) amidotransferase subunit A
LFTQPLAALGCPVLTVPIARPGRLPAGVQLLAAPDREDLLFALAADLEQRGLVQTTIAAIAT